MKLFTVGPVEMDSKIKEIGGAAVPYFRTAEFSQTMKKIERQFCKLAGAASDTKLIVLTASGTGAMEAAVCNVLDTSDKALIINGGSFGQRFVLLCQCFGIPYEQVGIPFGRTLTSEDLMPYADKGFTALLVNLHETSTGQLYDGKMLGRFCKEQGLLFIVDAISTLFADPFHMEEMGADVVICSSQKAMALPPGLSFLLVNPRACERILMNHPRTMYFDLRDYLKNMERGQTPFTPAVGIIMQLEYQMDKISDLGVDAITRLHKERADYFRGLCLQMGIPVVDYPKSNALTPIYFEKENAYEAFLELKDKYDLMLTPNGGELSSRILRVGHLGDISREDLYEVAKRLREVM